MKTHLWFCLAAVVTIHMALVLALVASFFVLPFAQPWYVATPLCIFVYFYCTNKVKCLMTDFENYLRRKVGLKVIGGFVGHYFVKPFRKKRKKAEATDCPEKTPEWCNETHLLEQR